MSNWKSPGPNNIQGFWLKNLTKMHDKLLHNLIQCIEEGNVPRLDDQRKNSFDPER